MFARKDDSTWFLWIDCDSAKVGAHYDVCCVVAPTNGEKQGLITSEGAGESKLFPIFEFGWAFFGFSDFIKNSPFRQLWDLSKNKKKAHDLCVKSYETMCHFLQFRANIRRRDNSDKMHPWTQKVYKKSGETIQSWCFVFFDKIRGVKHSNLKI